MVQHTPILNLPYVEPTDTVTTYPTTAQELANQLETKLNLASYGPAFLTGTPVAVTVNSTSWVYPNTIALTSVNYRRLLILIGNILWLSAPSSNDFEGALSVFGAVQIGHSRINHTGTGTASLSMFLGPYVYWVNAGQSGNLSIGCKRASGTGSCTINNDPNFNLLQAVLIPG